MSQVVRGYNGRLAISVDGCRSYIKITNIQTADNSNSPNQIDITNWDSNRVKETIGGIRDVSLKIKGLVDPKDFGQASLEKQSDANRPVRARFHKDFRSQPFQYLDGWADITNFSQSSPTDGVVDVSFDLTFKGKNLKKMQVIT